MDGKNSINGVNESKRFNMKQFILAARDYSQTRTEDSANLINRYLQLISVTIDLSIFDPHTVVSEFFVSLHELLSNLECGSSMAWFCVNVLSVACRHPTTRHSLIHTYQFLPPLSRLIGDHLVLDKKIKLLSLMQELTCGIKISWQVPHLPHLMKTLTKWIESNEEETISYSLGILVNLCYKNLPAIYTLTRCTDIKKFVRTCLALKAPKLEVHICKLLIILEHVHGNTPDSTLIKMVQITFKSVSDAIKAYDSISLRHNVDFFMEIHKQKEHKTILTNFGNYYTEVERLLEIIENNMHRACPSGDRQYDPECIAMVFEFLHVIIDFRMNNLIPLYPKMITIALKWIQTELVCSEALSILRTIAINTDQSNYIILEPILNAVPILTLALDNNGDNIEHNKRQGAIMQLFQILVQTETFKIKILEHLNENTLYKVFAPLTNQSKDVNTSATETMNMYIYALSLIDNIVQFDSSWLVIQRNLLNQKEIHVILAEGLYNGSQDIKKIILQIMRSEAIPVKQIAQAMSDLQIVTQMEEPVNQNLTESLFSPIMSVTQSEKLDKLIAKLNTAYAQNNLANIFTSDVMELYEYKLASLGHAERAAIASVEAASQRCTHLQHRTAQLTAELSRAHQILFHTQQKHECTVKEKDEYLQKYNESSNKATKEKERNKILSVQLEKLKVEKELMLDNFTKKITNLEDTNDRNEKQINEYKTIIDKLESSNTIMESQLKKKEELIVKANSKNEYLCEQLNEAEEDLKRTKCELSSQINKYEEVCRELESKKNIVEAITRLTNGKN